MPVWSQFVDEHLKGVEDCSHKMQQTMVPPPYASAIGAISQ
jgi:hypothetical protein